MKNTVNLKSPETINSGEYEYFLHRCIENTLYKFKKGEVSNGKYFTLKTQSWSKEGTISRIFILNWGQIAEQKAKELFPKAFEPEEISGPGFILFPKKFELNYLFEVADMATDDKTGESCSAGLRLKLYLIKNLPFKDKKFYLDSAREMKRKGLFGVKPNRIKLITWEEFCAKGYNQ